MVTEEQIEEAEMQASRWIAQRETGPWTNEDEAALQHWLMEATLHRSVYFRLHGAWKELGRLSALGTAPPLSPTEFPEAPSQDLRAPLQYGRRALAGLAAALVVTVTAGLLVFKDNIFPARNAYRTVVGGLQAVPMDDGSRVILNTDSALRISLTPKERRVDLQQGEAFFQVAKDQQRPFVVIAGNKRVVALGTQFCVRRGGDEVIVSVTEGTVRLDRATERAFTSTVAATASISSNEPGKRPIPTPAASLLLLAGSMADSKADGTLVQQAPVREVEQRLSWRSGVLTFHDTALADAAEEFNRYNKRKITIRDAAVGRLRVGGIFGTTALDSFIYLLERGFPVQVAAGPDQIILSSGGH